MATQRSVEIRVGIFVLICLAVGAGLIWKFGKLSPSGGHRYQVTVTFDNVTGLIPDANVMYAGVSVGKVRSIQLDRTGKFRALVTLGIYEGIEIPRDARFVINQSGLLGDRYVDIVPGGGSVEPLPAGATVAGSTSVDLTEALRNVVEVLHQAAGTIERVNGMLRRIDGAIQRVDQMTLSTQNLHHVSSTLAQIDATTSNTVQLTASLQRLVDEGRGSVTNTLASFSAAADNVRGTTKRVDDFVRDTQMDIKRVTKNLTESTQRLNDILARVEKGEGTAGKLLNDTAVHDELLKVLHNLEQYGFFYKTWLGPKVKPAGTNTTTETPRRPSTLDPPPGGRAPVPARPATRSTEGRP